MRNKLLILVCYLLSILFFNSNETYAQATIVAGSAVAAKGEIGTNHSVKLSLSYFKALSKDDCESEMTLSGTLEIIDIEKPKTGQRLSSLQIKSNKKKTSRGISSNSHSSNGPGSFSSNPEGEGYNYQSYSIPPTILKGGQLSFNNSAMKDLIRFGDQFYILFKLEDIDRRCGRAGSGKDPIDVNPNPKVNQSLKLLVDMKANTIRVVAGDKVGQVVGSLNQFFTVKGNIGSKGSAEVGELRLRVVRKKINGSKGPGSFKSKN